MKKLFLSLLAGIFFTGCNYDPTYPDIPALEFKALSFGNDNGLSTFTLTATFTDGDGDIGYYQDRPNDSIFDDKQSPYYYNFIINAQVFSNGDWRDTSIISFIDTTGGKHDTTFFTDDASSRLPYLTQSGQNKGLKGDIDKTTYLPAFLGDSIRFTAFIYDRALHRSNLIYTPGYFFEYH
jgi:hypothetical protein